MKSLAVRIVRCVFVLVAWLACVAAMPKSSSAPPPIDADLRLSDGRTLHLRALPLGQLDGTIRDGVHFDASGTRAALLATFPEGAVDGDWRRSNPTQAYVADIVRRTLVALTDDGEARSIRWIDGEHVAVDDGGVVRTILVGAAGRDPRRQYQLVAMPPQPSNEPVSSGDVFRLQVFPAGNGSYAIGQVGAVRLRTAAIAGSGQAAIVGPYFAWIDDSHGGGPSFSRAGPDDVLPPAFVGTPYGASLTPIVPLGHEVYQAAYRNGVAYFAFSFGLSRIVAATSNFISYTFAQLPAQPAFTVGDGLGAGADGILYFARPEDGTLQLWRRDRYVDYTMQFPDDVSDVARLDAAMTRIVGPTETQPPLWADSDALDAEAMEWRIYPIGDVTGQGWIASYLGRAYVAGSNRKFSEIAVPGSPFVALGRTDDGRLWGAAPMARTIQHGIIESAWSRVWSSRDGVHWNLEATVHGDAGAVGMRDGTAWIAATAFEANGPGVEVARLGGDAQPALAVTGARYAGEDLSLASLAGSLYLICGGAPGSRAMDQSGPLVALRLDTNLSPSSGSAAPVSNISAFLAASIDEIKGASPVYEPTIVTNIRPLPSSPGVRIVSFDDERRYEFEYAWHPYPLAAVSVSSSGDVAVVTRSLATGPLAASGRVERWKRAADGTWRLVRVLSHWSL